MVSVSKMFGLSIQNLSRISLTCSGGNSRAKQLIPEEPSQPFVGDWDVKQFVFVPQVMCSMCLEDLCEALKGEKENACRQPLGGTDL
jgi:hypothetical protein